MNMSRHKRNSVQLYHDRVANQYDDIYDDLYWQWHDTLTWDYLKNYLPRQQNEPVIDLGCGTGKWAIKMAQSGYHVTCLDISIKMVDSVRRKAEQWGLTRKIECIQADLMDLSGLPQNHFALATAFGEPICSTAIPPKALKQINQILAPGGLLVATVDNRFNAFDFFLERNNVEELGQFVKNGKTHWLTRDKREQFELFMYSPTQLTKLLHKAGFVVIDLLGKTVLPMRKYRQALEDKTHFRQLIKIEKKLAHDPDAIGRAAHLQVVARKTS